MAEKQINNYKNAIEKQQNKGESYMASSGQKSHRNVHFFLHTLLFFNKLYNKTSLRKITLLTGKYMKGTIIARLPLEAL